VSTHFAVFPVNDQGQGQGPDGRLEHLNDLQSVGSPLEWINEDMGRVEARIIRDQGDGNVPVLRW